MLTPTMSALIGDIYEAALEPSLWPRIMAQMAETVPCAVATFYSHDLHSSTPAFEAHYGGNPIHVADYVERWASANPIIEAMRQMEPGQVASLAMIMDYDAFEQSPFFVEWGRPQGYVDAANILLERTPSRLSSVSLIRHERHGRVDQASIARLEMLAPHFVRSARIGRALSFTAFQKDSLEKALDAFSAPTILFDDKAHLVFANMSAQSLFKNAWSATLKHIVASYRSAAKNTVDRGSFLIKTHEEARLICHWTRVSGRLAPSSNYVLVVLQNPSISEQAIRAAARAFALTAREAEVLFHIVEFGRGPEAAAALGISKETARTHLRHILAKTQAKNQVQLVKLVSGFATPLT